MEDLIRNMENFKFYMSDDVKTCYGRIVSENELLKIMGDGYDFILDNQNLNQSNLNLIENCSYRLVVEGYELTGHCDLYQYYFTKIKKEIVK